MSSHSICGYWFYFIWFVCRCCLSVFELGYMFALLTIKKINNQNFCVRPLLAIKVNQVQVINCYRVSDRESSQLPQLYVSLLLNYINYNYYFTFDFNWLVCLLLLVNYINYCSKLDFNQLLFCFKDVEMIWNNIIVGSLRFITLGIGWPRKMGWLVRKWGKKKQKKKQMTHARRQLIFIRRKNLCPQH